MRTTYARLLIGATLLVAGFGLLSDGSVLRNALVQSATGALDFKDRQCRKSSTAAGSACPSGCEARAARSPEDYALPSECRSHWWIATCGKACDPAPGFVRLSDGRLADAQKLVVTLASAPKSEDEHAFAKLGLTPELRFDGLYRYDMLLKKSESLSGLNETKKRLAALPSVSSVDYSIR